MRLTVLRFAALAVVAACGESGIGPAPPPGTPAQLSIATQPSSTAQSGAPLAVQPVVRLKDSSGAYVALPGIVVTAAPKTAGATVSNATATTDGSGAAHFSALTVSGTAGTVTLSFSSGALASVDAQPLTLSAGAPAQLGVAVQPSTTATAGVALATQPSVQLKDAAGNATSRSGVIVAAAVVSGSVTVSSGTATTGASGVATFSGLTLSGTAGSYTLRFSATGLGQVDAAAPTLLGAGAATQLALTTQPSTTASNGAPLATQPVTQLRDAYGNTAAQSGVKVIATIVSGPSGASLGGDTATSDVAGNATFSALKITGTLGNYTLRFTATGFASAVAAAATALAAGAPAKIALTTQPPTVATNDVTFGQQPVAQVQDSSGNPVAQSGVVVTMTVQGGGPTVTNGTATTDATGKATFSGLKLTGLTGGYTLVFTTTSLGSVNAASTLFLQAGAATQLTITRQPSTTSPNAQPLPQQPIVRLADVSGNFATQSGITVTATLTSGSAAFSGNTVVTDGFGVAQFTTLTLTGQVASCPCKFRFSATGLTAADAAAATSLTAGAASQLVLTTQPSTTATSGQPLATQPVVQLQDVSGNPVATSGVQVTAQLVSGSPTVTNGTATTNAQGAAVFSGLTLTGPAGSYTLRFTAPALPSVASVDAAQPTVLN